MTWEIVATRHDAHHVIAELKREDGVERTVYFTAGSLAALGRTSAPLYDGKPGKGAKG